MEIRNIKIGGHEVNVIFTGSHYYFHNEFFGLIAVAERDYATTEITDINKTTFRITTGNAYCDGGSLSSSVVRTAAREHIQMQEARYLDADITYTYDEKRLETCQLRAEMVENKAV